MADLPTKRLTRPTALDARDWRDMICDALNELNVHVGEDFILAPAERSTRPPILDDKTPATRAKSAVADDEREVEQAIEESAPLF